MAEPDLLSIYYTVASIIVIYLMFVLQAWITRVDATRDSLEKAKNLAKNDMERISAKGTANRLLAEFPWISSITLLFVLLILIVLAINVSEESAQNPILTTTPAYALAGASIFSLAYAHWKWGRILRGFVNDL